MDGPGDEREPPVARVPRNLGLRAGMLLGAAALLALAFVFYTLYARGVFEATQRLVLVADNAEGVTVGMDLTFAGFPIGRVRRIALAEDGKARIEVDVPTRDAKWLRRTSVFTLEVSLFGAARIRAFTGNLEDAPLEDGAVRPVLRGDTTEEIPRMIATLRAILDNAERLTGPESSLARSLADLRAVTERMAGRTGVLGALLGEEAHAQKVLAALDRANALVASLGAAASRLEGLIAKSDERLLGAGGIADEATKAAAEARALLAEIRARLAAVEAILADAQATAASARTAAGNVARATTDLAALRAEVEASLRRLGALIEDIDRRWPFERDTRLRLP
ncbi:MAG: MlaD family protein [Burkholderiales bacterium]|nr:MlaD family protein [Burkholderiales bacterium]